MTTEQKGRDAEVGGERDCLFCGKMSAATRARMDADPQIVAVREGRGEWRDAWIRSASVYVEWSEWGISLRVALPWGKPSHARCVGIGGQLGPIGFYFDYEHESHLFVDGKPAGVGIGQVA